jgi:hypothetical protein
MAVARLSFSSYAFITCYGEPCLVGTVIVLRRR